MYRPEGSEAKIYDLAHQEQDRLDLNGKHNLAAQVLLSRVQSRQLQVIVY